jgi:membrane-associated phospholipid phosphatase
VLIYAFPADSALIESHVREEEATLPEWQRASFRSAERIGRAIGHRVVERARNDGFNVVWTGTVPVGPGKWSSLSVPPAPPLLPLAGSALPFFLTKGSQFRPVPPPVFDSPSYRESLAEVRRIFDTRTPLQDSIAKFWAIPTGGLIAGYWNTKAMDLIVKGRLGERAATRVLAVMNAASHDALIACHDAKYTFWYIRPSGADTAIKTSVGVPNHPSYPSNHSCFSGTSATVLGAYFPAAREELQAKANEASISRLYGGLHYRFDLDAGLEIARKVSRVALEAAHRGRMTALAQP